MQAQTKVHHTGICQSMTADPRFEPLTATAITHWYVIRFMCNVRMLVIGLLLIYGAHFFLSGITGLAKRPGAL